MNENTDLKAPAAQRLDRLSRRGETYDYNPGYSKIIRKLRVLLPIIAAAAITITIVWSNMSQEDIIAVEATDIPPTAQNELLNPSFESRDEKGQPYKLTALQAKQDPADEKRIMLTKPSGDIFLTDGNKAGLLADTGEFTQDQRQLLLQGNVQLSYNGQYKLSTQQLHVDMMNSTAQTDTKVNVTGPAGTLDAAGLRGYANESRIVFNGPAKVVLTDVGNSGLKGLSAP